MVGVGHCWTTLQVIAQFGSVEDYLNEHSWQN